MYIIAFAWVVITGRAFRKCLDCGVRMCPVMTWRDEEEPHRGWCGK